MFNQAYNNKGTDDVRRKILTFVVPKGFDNHWHCHSLCECNHICYFRIPATMAMDGFQCIYRPEYPAIPANKNALGLDATSHCPYSTCRCCISFKFCYEPER